MYIKRLVTKCEVVSSFIRINSGTNCCFFMLIYTINLHAKYDNQAFQLLGPAKTLHLCTAPLTCGF